MVKIHFLSIIKNIIEKFKSACRCILWILIQKICLFIVKSDCKTPLDLDGKCITVEKCNSHIEIIKGAERTIMIFILSMIAETVCGFDDYIPKVRLPVKIT